MLARGVSTLHRLSGDTQLSWIVLCQGGSRLLQDGLQQVSNSNNISSFVLHKPMTQMVTMATINAVHVDMVLGVGISA